MWFGKCACFCLCSDMISKWSYFTSRFHGHRMTLSDVGVLRNVFMFNRTPRYTCEYHISNKQTAVKGHDFLSHGFFFKGRKLSWNLINNNKDSQCQKIHVPLYLVQSIANVFSKNPGLFSWSLKQWHTFLVIMPLVFKTYFLLLIWGFFYLVTFLTELSKKVKIVKRYIIFLKSPILKVGRVRFSPSWFNSKLK